MKRSSIYSSASLLCLAMMMFPFSGCSDDDPAKATDEQEKEVMRSVTEQLTSDLASVSKIVAAQLAGTTVNNVSSDEKNSILNFADGTSQSISKEYKDIILPSITVQEQEGVYYWGLADGSGNIEILKDASGKGLPAGTSVPKVRANIEQDIWEISSDNGTSWKPGEDYGYGTAKGSTYFCKVETAAQETALAFKAGGSLVLKMTECVLAFDTEEPQAFEPGEEKAVTYTLSGATAAPEVTAPKGWTATLADDNKTLNITAPEAAGEDVETAGKVTMKATSIKGEEMTAELEVSVEFKKDIRFQIVWTQGDRFFTDIHFGPASESGAEDLKPANTFLVRPGKTYRFKTNVRGNGAEGIKALGLQETDGTVTIGDLTMNVDGSIDPALTGEYEYLYFTTNNEGTAKQGGNGVVSIVINDKVQWTWLVWSRDEDPALETIGGYQQMGVNIGSWGPLQIQTDILGQPVKSVFCYRLGLLFPWGFNVPQPCYDSMRMDIRFPMKEQICWTYYYDEENKPEGAGAPQMTTRKGKQVVGLAEAVARPVDMADLSGAAGEDIYANLWGGKNGEKTVFDPSPYGFRMPEPDLYLAYEFGIPGMGGLSYKVSGQEKLSYIQSGSYLYYNEAEGFLTLGEEFPLDGYYWTNKPAVGSEATIDDAPVYDAAHSMVFHFYADKGTKTFERKNGAYIRCVKYNKEN